MVSRWRRLWLSFKPVVISDGRLASFLLLVMLASAVVVADDTGSPETPEDTETIVPDEIQGVRFGGPNAVDNQLEEDAAPVKGRSLGRSTK